MPDILNTGLTGLLAFQRALATTSHNVANVNTDGYSRQRVELATRDPIDAGAHFVGRGTHVTGIERITDRFVNTALNDATTHSARSERLYELSARVDNLLADPQSGLSSSLDTFFSALDDFANDPSSRAPREVALGAARQLTTRFHSLDQGLVDIRDEVNARLRDEVGDINALAASLAELNGDVVDALRDSHGELPNDLLDRREHIVNQLSELIAVSTTEQENGALNVFIGNGQALVLDHGARLLQTVNDPFEPGRLRVAHDGPAGATIIDQNLNGGSLGGVLEFRRDMLEGTRNELGRLAIVMGTSFNDQLARGIDLNGLQGAALFDVAAPEVIENRDNTGTGTATVTLDDPTQLSASDYELGFDGASYTLTRLSDEQTVSGTGTLTFDGMTVTPGAGMNAGDSFLVRPSVNGAESFVTLLSDPRALAGAAPIASTLANTNTGDLRITQADVVDIDDPQLTASARIEFNDPPSTFNIIDEGSGTAIATGLSYTSGNPISANGWSLEVAGQPNAGDAITIGPNIDAVSDNRNALALSELRNTKLIEGAETYGEQYAAVVAKIGNQTRQAELTSEAQSALLSDARSARENVSGVNLDEEAIALSRYQQAYQASAQVMSIANTLFDTLLSAVRR